MTYHTIDFLTAKGEPMLDVDPPANLRYREGVQFTLGDATYEIVKTWSDDAASYLKVWLLKTEEAPRK